MAAAPSLPPVTVEEYLDGGLWAEFEYEDGVLVPRNSGARDHARMVAHLCQWLGSYRAHVTAYAALVLSISWKASYRVPDVCCYPADIEPGETLENQPPPLAIFEVLSKTDWMSEIQEKCDEYTRLGVAHIFIVDPHRRAVLAPQGGGLPAIESAIGFSCGEETISIAFSDLFKGF